MTILRVEPVISEIVNILVFVTDVEADSIRIVFSRHVSNLVTQCF